MIMHYTRTIFFQLHYTYLTAARQCFIQYKQFFEETLQDTAKIADQLLYIPAKEIQVNHFAEIWYAS